jgi:peptide/nickel transport system permease protein
MSARSASTSGGTLKRLTRDGEMKEYIIRRLLLVLPIMFGVSFLTFLTFRVIPGDAAILACGFGCTEEVVEAIREDFGLNKPWWRQYLEWAGGVFKGDLGTSVSESRLPLTTELERRLPITIELMIMTIILSLVLGILPGILSAIRANTAVDWLSRLFSVLWLSIPNFYLAILVIVFGSLWFGWSPPQFGRGFVPFFDDPWVNLQQFFFPSLILALGIAAVLMRLTRSSMLEVMRNDYIRTAWAKGLRERTVVVRHALKNALIPVVTLVGLQVGGLIGGAVLVESVFALPGIGVYTLEAIIRRDLFVVQGLVLIFAVSYVVTNLLVDVGYAWLDPRIRYS